MKPAKIRRNLQQAEAHVRRAAEHIATQKRIVAELEASGHGTGIARDLLKTFEEVEQTHIADRDRLASNLTEAEQQETKLADG